MANGAKSGIARTSNYVTRSSIPSRRPCLARASMFACMLVLSTPRSTSSILVQQTYGTANTMTLSVLRLLRWARCMYGRRGLRSLALGPGITVSSLVDVRSSAGVYPTTRLLRWWWDRCGRNSCRRSLLLRWHVDEEDEDLARVNRQIRFTQPRRPLPGAPKMSGKLIHEHLWGPADRAPFGSAGGGDRTKSRSRRSTRAVYPASELSGEIILLLLLV